MTAFLQRAQSPLSAEEWQRLDDTVRETARQQLVGRQLLSIFGPIGAGHQFVPRLTLNAATTVSPDSSGPASGPITVATRTQIPLTLVCKDFILHWRDVEAARQLGLPLDMAAAGAAAAMCAAREDELIFQGDKALGLEGLATAVGHRTMTRRDWGIGSHAFLDVIQAVDHLSSAGFFPPYALVCSPNLYACLLRSAGPSGGLELQQVREVCTAGVFSSNHVKSAILLAVGAHNFDLVIGQDLTVAYLRCDNLDYVFRVLETVALRVKRPGAICSLVPRTASPTHRVRRGVPEEATGAGD